MKKKNFARCRGSTHHNVTRPEDIGHLTSAFLMHGAGLNIDIARQPLGA